MTVKDMPVVDRALKREFKAQTHGPFRVLVGTILSARTKDVCTAGAVGRLFGVAMADSQIRSDLN